MLHQDVEDPALSRRPELGDPWCDPVARTLRRAQPPPADRRSVLGAELRFWGCLVVTALLATLIPITAAVGANLVDSTGSRILAGIAIMAVTASAVAASGAATDAAHMLGRDETGRDEGGLGPPA